MTDRDASLTRLNKFISETGFCSRREADRYIAEGRVTINGVVPEMGTKVAPGDEVLVNGKPLKAKQEAVYLAFNKPVGITCRRQHHRLHRSSQAYLPDRSPRQALRWPDLPDQ